MRYVSVCAGIEAASMAWHALGWEPAAFSEVDDHARAVLSHRFPDVPLVGDFRDIRGDEYGPVQLLVGGTPCQSFSIAGKRGGIEDTRGHLTLEFPRLGRRLGVDWIVWENVPGVFSDDGGYTFRRVVAEFGECGFHVAWRKLDTQYVRVDGYGRAVPQRRERVFIVGHTGNWAIPPAVLFEPEGGKRSSPPRREAGQAGTVAEQAPSLSARVTGGGGLGTDFDLDEGLIPESSAALTGRMGQRNGMPSELSGTLIPEVCPTMDQRNRGPTDFALNGGLVPEVSGSVSSKWAKGTGGPAGDEMYNLVPVAVSLRGREGGGAIEVERDDVSPALRASQGGGDKQHVLAAVAIQERAVAENPDAGPDGMGVNDSGAAYTLETRSTPQSVAFSCKDYGLDATEEVAPTLRAMPHETSHMNGGGQIAVAVHENQRAEVRCSDVHPALTSGGGKMGQSYGVVAVQDRMPNAEPTDDSGASYPLETNPNHCVFSEMRVRRITCVEAERLQGFPDAWTLVPRFPGDKKLMSNSARYKMIGNAMSVNVMRWIGRRIELIDRIYRDCDE